MLHTKDTTHVTIPAEDSLSVQLIDTRSGSTVVLILDSDHEVVARATVDQVLLLRGVDAVAS